MLHETMTHPPVAFEDDRGVIVNLVQGEMSHLAFCTRRAGAIFGNHVHPAPNVQRMMCLRGSYLSVSCPLDEAGNPYGEVVSFRVEAGDLTETPAQVGHGYYALGSIEFLNINTSERQPDGYGIHTSALRHPLVTVCPHRRSAYHYAVEVLGKGYRYICSRVNCPGL